MNFLFLFFFLSISFCFADFEVTQANTEADISSIVEGVNTITGSYSFIVPIHCVQGVQPIQFYESFNSHSSTFFRRPMWAQSHFSAFDLGGEKIGKKWHNRAFYVEDGGNSICLIEPHKKKNINLKLSHAYSPTRGVTNAARGPISASTNLDNLVLKINDENEKSPSYAVKADGTLQYFGQYRYFSNNDSSHLLFRLKEQIYPNGNHCYFQYGQEYRDELFLHPSKLTFTNPSKERTFIEDSISSVHWDSNNRIKYLNHTFSDGHTVAQAYRAYEGYPNKEHTGPLEYFFYLAWTTSTCGPREYYEYEYRGPKKQAQLRKRAKEEDRYTLLEYYKEEDGLSKNDPCIGRVKQVKAPAATTNEPVTLYSFTYQIHTDHRDATKLLRGSTLATDGNGNSKCYIYDDNHRLIKIHWLGKEGTLPFNKEGYNPYKREYFSWSEEGRLRYWQLNDTRGCLRYKNFEYDKKGNVLKETLWGAFSRAYQPFALTNEKPPKEIETQSTYYTYSDDRFNNLLTKQESGLLMRCTYVEGTNVLKSKIVTDHQAIHLRTFYSYDANGALIEEISDDGFAEDKEDLSGITQRLSRKFIPRTEGIGIGLPLVEERYGYDCASGCEKLISKTVNTYNHFYKLCSQDVYDSQGCFAYRKEWVYDNLGLLIEEIDALGQTTVYRYDANHNRIYELSPGGQKEVFYTYDYMNRLIGKEIKDPEGGRFTTSYRYDVMGNLIAEIDHYGNETSYAYDAYNRCTQIKMPGKDFPLVQKEYDAFDNVITLVDAEGFVTKTEYNAFNQPVCVTYPDGSQETMRYDGNRTLIEKKARTGLITRYSYDALKRLVKEEHFDAQNQLLSVTTNCYNSLHLIASTDAMGLTTTYTYDYAGRLVKETMGEKELIKSYDALGRVVAETLWDGLQTHTTHFVYDLNNRLIESWEENGENWEGKIYDAEDRLISIQRATTQGKQTTLISYDGLDRPISVHFSNGDYFYAIYDPSLPEKRVFYPDGKLVHTVFDALGRVASIEKRNVNGDTTYRKELSYDLNGKVVKELYFVYAPDQIKTVTNLFSYDSCGQLLEQIEGYGDFNQRLTSFTYLHGLKSSCTKADGRELFYTYDPFGRLLSESASDGSIDSSWKYNARGQPVTIENKQGKTERTYDLYGRLTQEILANGLTCQYSYDLANRLTGIRYPDGTEACYRYNATALKEASYKQARIQWNYHSSGMLESLNLANGDTAHYAYDERARLTSIQSALWSQTEITYDRMGNIMRYLLNGESFDFEYDDSYQLSKEKEHTYQHDSLCNRLQKDDLSFIYDALNQLLSSDCSYDANGNLTRYKEMHFTYDAHDQLLSLSTPTTTYHYSYDPFHRRLSDGERYYAYYDNHELGAFTQEGICLEKRILDPHPEKDSALLIELDQELYTPYHDHRGNICALATESIVESYRYSAFEQEEPFATRNPYRFFGKRNDASGLICLGYRYYHPTLGRYLTADPLNFADGPNRYAYCANDPLSKIDLFGLFGQNFNSSFSLFSSFSSFNHFSSFPCLGASRTPYRLEEVWADQNPLLYSERSRVIDLGLPASKDIGIGFVNGILNSPQDAFKSLDYLSQLSGGHNIQGVYNVTHTPAKDAFECIMGLLHVGTEPVAELHKMWDNFFSQSSPDACFLMNCHSQGAIHTKNALETYDNELRQRILVVAIAPGGYIDKRTCGKVIHYCAHAWRDPIPHFHVLGRWNAGDTVQVLDSHPDAGFFDHSFKSPTYADKLKDHIHAYLNSGGKKI